MTKEYKVIDDFLPKEQFNRIKSLVVNNQSFPWFINNYVVTVGDQSFQDQDKNWNWYMMNMIYEHPRFNGYSYTYDSPYFNEIGSLFAEEFSKVETFKNWIRIKANLFPYTEEVKEHQAHYDYKFSHKAAVFSLNTCDGYTTMSNSDKVDSVENRVVIFNGSQYHKSSTTSNSKQRLNFNFNWF